jgi:hypothetical protein
MILVVYVANLLAHEVSAGEHAAPPSVFDMDLLQEAGAAGHLPQWRKFAAAALVAEAKMVS